MRALLLPMVASALAGCGRIGFDVPNETDASSACVDEQTALGGWGIVTQVAATEPEVDKDDDDPAPSADGLELYFVSTREPSLGEADVWRVRRDSPTDAWSDPERVDELSSPMRENTVELSADGLTAWVVSNKVGTKGGDDIWVTTRPDRASLWSSEWENETELNSAVDDRSPSVFHDGHAMMLHSARGGDPEIFVTTRDADGRWKTPTELGGPRGIRPWVSPCGYELYFQAERGTTGPDFYVARRASLEGVLEPEMKIGDLSGASFDQDLRLSPDRRHAYFASGRDGKSKIYEATR